MHASPRPRRPLGRAVFRPPRALGVITGGALAAWALVFALLATVAAAGAPAEFKTFLAWVVASVLFALAVLFGYWAYCLWTLTYTIERAALAIRWGFRTVLVPIDSIQRMVPGRTLTLGKVRGITWWGCHVGEVSIPRIGPTLVFSTHSAADEVLYILTGQNAYALTVLDQASFAEEIQQRAAMGPVIGRPPVSSISGVGSLSFWTDRVLIGGTALAALVCVILVGYVFSRYPGMPEVVPLNFPSFGGVARAGNKSEILRVAYLGAGILGANVVLGALAHHRERAAGVWLVATAVILQAVLLGAAIVAISRTT